MLKYMAIGVSAFVALLLVVAALRPDTFRVERTVLIKAAPEQVAAQISDFHRWGAWSPWEKKDPAMQRTFSGAASGMGARYSWQGDQNVGSGSMEITSATAEKITIQLDFLAPFEAHNIAEFTLRPQAEGTEVSWAMTGPVPFFARIIHLFFDMDKMVGADFEAGLSNLKAFVEAPHSP
ncbi:MAG: SRPBCC family protein [Moraxellaceae bacterium]|nr:SRPBCC family protein [Moraxellaceae bacterium]